MDDTPAAGPSFPLREHHLAHIAELHIGEEIFTSRFARSCSMASCTARCCREGVLVDVAHRDRVLSEAALIVQHMEPAQEHDPAHWFVDELDADPDFPSGVAVNTTVVNGGCVFLDSGRRCVLHLAAASSPGLKPFYCSAFPIAVNLGRVTVETDWCPGETACCGSADDGVLTTLDVCEWELGYVLGEAGMRELRMMEQAHEG
jgi:hypothetical protein